MKPSRPEIPIERLRELFDYDPDTGILTWRYRPDVRPTWNTRYAGKPAGCYRDDGYCKVVIGACGYHAHRVIYALMTGAWPTATIDHANGNPSDNRWGNLRPATFQQNMANRRGPQKNNALGIKGVCLHKPAGKYVASMRVNRKNVYLGLFLTPEAAGEAYRTALIRQWGEFAGGV